MNGPPRSTIEYKRHGEEVEGEEGPLCYHRAPLVPAATYLRTLIECYRSMDRVPMMDAYHSDPDWPKQAHRENMKWYFENVSDCVSFGCVSSSRTRSESLLILDADGRRTELYIGAL
jgi:hypothetical protein